MNNFGCGPGFVIGSLILFEFGLTFNAFIMSLFIFCLSVMGLPTTEHSIVNVCPYYRESNHVNYY